MFKYGLFIAFMIACIIIILTFKYNKKIHPKLANILLTLIVAGMFYILIKQPLNASLDNVTDNTIQSIINKLIQAITNY